MKNKSTRHKEDNVFKFLPFSERISNLEINVFHRVGHEYETQTDETVCYFYQAIEKWNVLNLTESYGDFKREVKPFENVTLTQLLFNKDRIAEILLKHLTSGDALSLQPLLEILVAFIQDLQADFCQYYPGFLNVLIDLLNTKDVEQLEWIFTSIAYAFKLLWRVFIKDIDSVFNLLLPLLSDTKPDYINNFAAESFAFVARKVKDRKTFLLMVLKTVKDTKSGISGSGRLLFEIVYGVNNQFHSCAETWLSLYFELLQDNKIAALLFEIIEEVVRHIVNNIYFQKSEIFWKIITHYLHDTLQVWTEIRKERYLNQILQCVGQLIEYRDGRFLLHPNSVISELIKLYLIEDLTEDILLSATKIVVLLLVSKNIQLQQEQANSLIRRILSLQLENIFLFFVENTFKYSLFEALILPSYLKYCVDTKLNDRSLKILAKLIQAKSPLTGNGIDLCNWNKYSLDFNSTINDNFIESILLKHLTLDRCNIHDNVNNYIYSLICLPHIKYVAEIEKLLTGNIMTLCEVIGEGQKVVNCLFLLLNTLECAVRTVECSNLVKIQDSLLKVILPLCNSTEFIGALKIIDLFFTKTKEETATMENLLVLHQYLENNFNSAYHEIRLHSTHIYSLFEDLLNQDNTVEEWRLFSICYQIECITPHVHTYREQLIHLDKLHFDRPQMSLCKNTEFKTVPLRYLCGTLYMNLQLLWDPVINIIASHANGLDMNTFWEVFVQELKTVVINVTTEDEMKETCNFSCDLLNELNSNAFKISVKPDFSNYRLLLWKAMALFPEIAESKTRDVSVLLLDFIGNEYSKCSTENALNWNVKQNDPGEITNLEDDTDETTIAETSTAFAKSKGKHNIRTLIQHLEVFAKVRSAKSMYREEELYKLYFDLLSHKSSLVQKIALDCIMTYKFKYLTPYKEHLYSLIDDKNFKNEIVAFNIDQESTMIQEEHRNELIPVIMKIVFSKMVSKTGLRTGGKSSGQFRRNIIFRFLAGCRENEMMNFIRMAFKYYNNYLSDNPLVMANTISSSINLEKFIPPKRLQSSLNMIHVILEQFGALMGNHIVNYLLKIILTIGVFIKAGFEQQNNLHIGYNSLFRNLRTSCIKLIDRIFNLFENYPWTADEIDAIYDVFIWPYIKKLPIEGVHSPTALLKLLITWGTYPRYFNLLVKHHDQDPELYPLSIIMLLFLNEKSHISVYNIILEMIEKLLTLEPSSEDIQIKLIVTNELPVCEEILEKLNRKENFNYGSCILLPHANSVLQTFKRKFESKSKFVNQRELFVLSRISELVWDQHTSDNLLQLLLPIVRKKCQNSGEEIILQLTTTLNNLLINVQHPENHIKQISPLFGDVTYPSSRKLLCQLLNIIATKVPDQYTAISEAVSNINAWDLKWIDQPDFQVRSDTFKRVQKMISENSINMELGILLIYCCFYLLKNEKDLALKENATYCLKTLSPYLVKKYTKIADRNYILDSTLFNLIRQNLKSKNSDVRNESISLLGSLARECPDAHVVLRDMHKLTNSQDLEVDFFENLTHLQIHRHGRALLKFSNVYKEELNLPNIRTLTQFLLPLTTHYLCNDKYINKHSLIDAANEAIGTVCRLLPWHQYEGLLKYYLLKLRQKANYQKQLVKLLVILLDSFHFDLHKGQLLEIVQADVSSSNTQSVEEPKVIKEASVLSTENEENKSIEDDGNEIEEILNDLEQTDDDIDDEDEESSLIENVNQTKKAYEKTTVLCKSAATRVIQTIKVILLPQLHKALAEMTHHEGTHKVNRKKISAEREEEDLAKVPISLALVKLLQKLPKEILDSNLPGIFMKLCTFLKSQLESVRRVTRETLQKIMTALGPSYLSSLLDEMIPLLSRGFQVHVLVYTVHSVLVSLKQTFKPKDVDAVLNTVIKLCNADLFGILAEEKEVEKIISKVSEAKSTKSFDTYHILGQYITEKCMMDLILPLQDILSTSRSFKIVNKAQECLRHIALGLIDNDFISASSLLKFSFGVTNESIPELVVASKPVLTEKEREKLGREKPDCLIIPAEPVYRSGHRVSKVKTSNNTNAHVIIEFGLRLCHLLLKRDKIKDEEFRQYLDPFVIVFKKCLMSKNITLNTISLQCFGWIFKHELPSLKNNIIDIAKLMFEILHKYGAAGLSKGDNFDLVVAAFKAMSVLVRDVKYFIVDTEQLKILLLYVEQDLYDHDRQATAFGLLKAIISRKLLTSELFDIMDKVAELSITSELPHVRLHSRTVSHLFLMDYPLGKRLDKHITFYLAQLKYETQTGRESAIEMIQTLINSFPVKVLKEYSGTFLVTLGARLINDPEPNCRKMVAQCINSMFTRVMHSDRDPLFNIIKVWLSEDNVIHKRLAAQLCGILVTVEKTTFEARLTNIMPVLKSQFHVTNNDNKPGKFIRLRKVEESNSEESEKNRDHHLFQVLQLLLKISAQCPIFLKQTHDIEEISKCVQQLLAYPHEWVRLAAAQFIGFVLSALDIKKLEELLLNNKTCNGYLFSDPFNDIKSLSLDLCSQLQPNSTKTDLAEQVVKNLVFIARAIQNLPISSNNKINLFWLTKRMRKVVNLEIVENPTSTVLRTEVFKWMAGVATAVDLNNLQPILPHLLAPLVREMVTTEESESSIRHLSKEVGNLIKKKIGIEKYTETISKLEQQLSVKRAERKRTRNQLAVTDPDIFAKKKIKHHEKKKEARKRKINERKGSVKKFKRKKELELDNSEIM